MTRSSSRVRRLVPDYRPLPFPPRSPPCLIHSYTCIHTPKMPRACLSVCVCVCVLYRGAHSQARGGQGPGRLGPLCLPREPPRGEGGGGALRVRGEWGGNWRVYITEKKEGRKGKGREREAMIRTVTMQRKASSGGGVWVDRRGRTKRTRHRRIKTQARKEEGEHISNPVLCLTTFFSVSNNRHLLFHQLINQSMNQSTRTHPVAAVVKPPTNASIFRRRTDAVPDLEVRGRDYRHVLVAQDGAGDLGLDVGRDARALFLLSSMYGGWAGRLGLSTRVVRGDGPVALSI